MPPRRICGNPLFLSWMEDLRLDAQSKNMKSAESYGKACKSLSACPVTYDRPRDLICLTGIGPKTIDILEKKWRAWCKENGRPIVATPEKRKKPRQPSTSPLPDGISDLDSDADTNAAAGPSERPLENASVSADATGAKVKGKGKAKAPAKPKAPKTYVPQARSGAYAILLALVLAIDNPQACTQVYMGKSELSRAAQPFSDSSFSASEKGSYYTAWNSMKTLVGKGLVYATGNPQRYCLTEEGYDTACAMRGLLPEYAHLPKYPFLHDTVPVSIAQAAALASATRIAAAGPVGGPSRLARQRTSALPSPPDSFHFDLSRSPSPPLRLAPRSSTSLPRQGSISSVAPIPSRPRSTTGPTGSRNRFQFWYISSNSARVERLDQAMIRLDPDEFVNLRKVEFRFQQRDHPFVSQMRLVDEQTQARVRDDSGQASLFGFVLEEGAPPRCSKFDDDTPPSGGMKVVSSIGDGSRAQIQIRAPDAGPGQPIRSKKRPSMLLESDDDDDLPLFGDNDLDHSMYDDLPGVEEGKRRDRAGTSKKPVSSALDMIDLDDDDDFLPMPGSPPAKRSRPPMTGRKEIGGSSFTFSRTTSASTGSTTNGNVPARATTLSVKKYEYKYELDEHGDLVPPPATRLNQVDLPSKHMTASMSDIQAGPSKPRTPIAVTATSSNAMLPRGPRLSSHMPVTNPLAAHYSTASVAAADAENIGEASASSLTPTFRPADALIFPPNSYSIVLIIDTREIESKSSRDRIAESLLAKGVAVETRALKLGDMCWIARHNDGHGGEEDEAVLDYVVERKRLDDLCSSIRDGRYSEQCHRLGNSGIRNVYYIVEDFQVAERMEYNGLQIQTAKSQIQVHNQFFLKETHKLSETIDFLCTMTRVIQTTLRGKELRVIPTKYLSRPTYKALQDRLRAGKEDASTAGGYLTSFEAYQALNDKSASITLRDKWARMLMCIKGMSAEKVAAVLDVWDTPRALWDDLKAHEKRFKADAKAREAALAEGGGELLPAPAKGRGKKKDAIRAKDMFFADRVQGERRRKIGDALSREIYRCFMGDEE